MYPDIHRTRLALAEGHTSINAEIEHSLATAKSDVCQHAFLKLYEDAARATALQGWGPNSPLSGLAVSVKDLFDMFGEVTAAGSVALSGNPPAKSDCPAVARLKAAGGVVLGRTNMTEFAFSGVGVNPHFGTPANAASSDVPRIPGGSSSGAAVSVATGAAFIGLGSDTGGSIRIPAALNGIVGFKSTARLVPTSGAVPLSSTLDTVCAMTRSVTDAITAHEIIAARRVTRSNMPLSGLRFAVAGHLMLDGMEPAVATAFQRALERIRASGAVVVDIDLPELDELTQIQSTGGFSAAESYAWHRDLLDKQAATYDPRVAVRIQRGATMTAFQYLDLIKARNDWIGRVTHRLAGFDAVLSPTVPIVAPTLASVAPGAAQDEAFFKVNAQLLRNTNVVNMLDGCAISIPCQRHDELPVGLMLWHGPMRDDTVLNCALKVEVLLQTS